MSARSQSTLWLVTMLVLAGCGSRRHCSGPPLPNGRTLLATDEAFARFARAHGAAAAFREFAAPDATSFPMGEAPVHGREAIYQSMLSLPRGELLWTPS